MSSEFKHLDGNNNFPGIDNVQPYMQYQNNFNYNRWTPEVTLNIYNVPWDADGRNTVIFDSVEARDEWFNKQESKTIKLSNSIFRNDPNGFIKLPIPFDEIYRYNYLSVDFGLATDSNNLVDYETKESITKHFYFIKEAQTATPTVSLVSLVEDFWTTFIYDAEIPLLMLERGHYPVAHSSIDKFLKSPIDNCEFLTSADVNYGDQTVIKNQTLVPLETGEKFILFSVPFNLSQLTNATTGKSIGSPISPTFSDIGDATGYNAQENVSYSFYDRNFSGVNIPCETVATNNLISNNLYTFAIRSADAYGKNGFFNNFSSQYPHLFREIKSFFILGRDLFQTLNSASFLGCTLYTVKSAKNIEVPITLNKSMFNFDSNISNIAKLYTYPYSMFQYTDINGNTFDIKPENCSKISIVKESCVEYPWLNITSFVTGVNGKGTGQIKVQKLDGTTSNENIWMDDFISHMSQYDIPTYAINFSSYLNSEISNSVDMAKTERNEKVNYQNTVRNANLNYNNTIASAQTSLSTTKASADTSKANADASADTTVANATRSSNTNTANLQATIAANQAINNTSINRTKDVVNSDIELNSYLVDQDNKLSLKLTDIQNAAAIASNNNNIQTVQANAVFGAFTGVAAGLMGNPGGAISAASSIAQAAIQTQAAATNTTIAMNSSDASTTATRTANSNKVFQQNIKSILKSAYNQQLNTSSMETNNSKNSTINSNTNALLINNTSANANTSKANASRTQTTTKSNATANYNTTASNALNSRNLSIANRQREAINNYNNYQNDFQKSQLQQNTTIASYSGNATPIEDNREIVRFSVRTQDKGAIAQAAAQFARYGYAWNGAIDLTDIYKFNQMKNFTYWKASEIWVTGDKLIEEARDYIENILLNGTTIWKNPNEIGKVSPYAQL